MAVVPDDRIAAAPARQEQTLALVRSTVHSTNRTHSCISAAEQLKDETPLFLSHALFPTRERCPHILSERPNWLVADHASTFPLVQVAHLRPPGTSGGCQRRLVVLALGTALDLGKPKDTCCGAGSARRVASPGRGSASAKRDLILEPDASLYQDGTPVSTAPWCICRQHTVTARDVRTALHRRVASAHPVDCISDTNRHL